MHTEMERDAYHCDAVAKEILASRSGDDILKGCEESWKNP
jgi:hypothetical protein